MAHFFEGYRADMRAPQTPEESQAWDHVRRVFGRQPSSIRCVSEVGKQKDVCLVKVHGNLDKSFEFICAGGFLVGIPPKRRGQK